MQNKVNTIDFQSFFLELLSQLSEREQEVLKKRYQLTADVESKNTLKKIGDFYGITRERVRQIEREAIQKLVQNATQVPAVEEVKLLTESLVHYLERKGGVAKESELIAEHVEVQHKFDNFHINAFLFVLDHLVTGVKVFKENDDFYNFWKLEKTNHDSINNFVDKVVEALTKTNKVVSEFELHTVIEGQLIDQLEAYIADLISKHPDLTKKDLLTSFLAITKKVEKNILDQWGLAEWSVIKPKKLADKIHLIFEHSNDPLHFREVAERINQAGFDHKKICAATVHNELIANENYVLIGRGIYALQSWGYAPGTVADIIVNILKEKQPLTREDIYQEVMKQRKVNPSTIYLSLINKDKFQKLSNGQFSLK